MRAKGQSARHNGIRVLVAGAAGVSGSGNGSKKMRRRDDQTFSPFQEKAYFCMTYLTATAPQTTGCAPHILHSFLTAPMNKPQQPSAPDDTTAGCISLRGVRVNNLKNISLDIPQERLVVVTGLSGSGKSSLAFDTLYAEGRRRYVESLSAYARQFMGRMHKPECDSIKGLPPAIAIEQKVSTRNPRSTVGTSTEIYDYLRLLFARAGHTFSPVSGTEVRRHTADDVVAAARTYSDGTRMAVLAPLVVAPGRSLRAQLEAYLQQGLTRLDIDGQMTDIEDYLKERATDPALDAVAPEAVADGISDGASAPRPQHIDGHWLLIDRLAISGESDTLARLADSVETAFYEGDGECALRIYPSHALHTFSTRFEADGMTFAEPSDQLFAFNSPLGACPCCEGFGTTIGIDEHLVVPDTSLSLYDDAVACWRGNVMRQWQRAFIAEVQGTGFPIFAPYHSLTPAQKRLLWHGEGLPSGRRAAHCIDAFFEEQERQSYKIQHRVILARYRGRTVCPVCHGSRLRPEAANVKVAGRSIHELTAMPVTALCRFFDDLQLSEHDSMIAARLLPEIRSRLHFLCDVGLGYLTLSRASNTLSGGESQRISLATSLGSSLVGSLYILDEPSIGLHQRDAARLIGVMKRLRDAGNTVLVVEHDEEIMRAADQIIDIGPDAGRLGGEVVWQGTLTDAARAEGVRSHTLDYLLGREHIPVPSSRRAWNTAVTVCRARANNLKGITVRFPLHVMTVVTGVSGSGKSTLVTGVLYPWLCRSLDVPAQQPGDSSGIEGDVDSINDVQYVDQNPIGRSSRSNPVIYVKAYDEIRRIMAAQPLARQMGFTSGTFSFNTDGGRCEACKGDGMVHVEMQFMADLDLECDVCHGKRFKPEVLEVRYHDRNIHDILEMTVDEAIEFFTTHGDKTVVSRLRPLQAVGLGYIKLGQPGSTLSGGESQRVKLASYLGDRQDCHTLFIFDEPTTGLHFHDIHLLIESFNALIERGHTVIVIEHNMDVIKCADHIIDLGPEGGGEGGQVVAEGTPEEVAASGRGWTARYLARSLQGHNGEMSQTTQIS